MFITFDLLNLNLTMFENFAKFQSNLHYSFHKDSSKFYNMFGKFYDEFFFSDAKYHQDKYLNSLLTYK
jgi:hypothetical protein